jgi:lipoprotein-anchoring transpeptidase ErfK/SrfK
VITSFIFHFSEIHAPRATWARGILLGVFVALPAASEPHAWTEPGLLPVPESAASIEVARPDEPLYRAPSAAAPRRGAAALGAHLPVFGAERGPGCGGRWLMTGPLAFMCEEAGIWSHDPPGETAGKRPSASGLPYSYHFVGTDGSLGYSNLASAEEGVPDMEFLKGFGVALTQTANKPGGDAFGLTTHGLWLPMRDLHPVEPFGFHGREVDPALNIVWVISPAAAVFRRPGQERDPKSKPGRFQALPLLEERNLDGHRWYRFADAAWISDRDARRPTPTTPPDGIRAGERWIDIDIDSQVLTAYAGDRPVFATLVSTGRGTGNSELATPKGMHRLWVKLLTSDMDNLDQESALENYAIQSVPWVMYFDHGYGLHGTFWHRDFGAKHSHGCVNLSPLDAEWIFDWTSPRLPPGWTAVLPTEYEPGTLIRVR